jgi:pilus assembly protein Flp/PilA
MLKELYEKFIVSVLGVLQNKKGQTLVEYALLLVLIAIVVYLMLKGAGLQVNNVYSKINSALAAP